MNSWAARDIVRTHFAGITANAVAAHAGATGINATVAAGRNTRRRCTLPVRVAVPTTAIARPVAAKAIAVAFRSPPGEDRADAR